jgi:hypothetical protein
MIVHSHVQFAHVQFGGPCAAPLRYHPQLHGTTGMESDRSGLARMAIGDLSH